MSCPSLLSTFLVLLLAFGVEAMPDACPNYDTALQGNGIQPVLTDVATWQDCGQLCYNIEYGGTLDIFPSPPLK